MKKTKATILAVLIFRVILSAQISPLVNQSKAQLKGFILAGLSNAVRINNIKDHLKIKKNLKNTFI